MTNEIEKTGQENPAQPAGWAVQYAVNPDAHPGGELEALEQAKRRDTAQWGDEQNRSPMDNVNPAQPPGFAVPAPTGGPIPGQGADAHPPQGPVVAKVFRDKSAPVIGAKVLLGTSRDNHALGEVVAIVDDQFGVRWRDQEDLTWEKRADYELVVRLDDDE